MSHTNRTKGNVKPSNSERAARLLQSNQFLSFSEASQTLSSIYGSNQPNKTVSSFDYDICSDFQLVFKHISKKDVNTKLKALQDFILLCKNKENSELIKAANFWFRIYRKLSNSLDWRIRQKVHTANYEFVSSLDSDSIIETFENICSKNNESFEDIFSNEVSFQNLITMPAVLWSSNFDAYSQSAEVARKVFGFLYPTEKRIDFLLKNYETILNYCSYSIFNKIPISFFYTTSLPSDSVVLFEEHLLVTSFTGLSSMINDIICYFMDKSDKDEDTDSTVECLHNIFLRINALFLKFKNIDFFERTNDTNESKNSLEDPDLLFASKKEKKKLKKENLKPDNKEIKKVCPFWKHASSPNNSVRISFFQTLNSFVRLTTLLSEFNKDKTLREFDQLMKKNNVWFKLYKNNLYQIIFDNFVDPFPEIRGLSWLLAIHLLSNKTLYNPWSVINCDKWLKEKLSLFITNGMKTPGSLIDFGLFNIGLEKYKQLYPEFFVQKDLYLSGLKLTLETYQESNIPVNVKLTIVFTNLFYNEEEPKIFKTFLFGLKNSFNRIVLQRDLDFLIELYFNILYQLIQKSNKISDENKLQQIVKLVEETITEDLYEILMSSFKNSNELLPNSQLYLNLLLLACYSNEYANKICSDSSKISSFSCINDAYSKLYMKIFKQIELEVDSLLSSKSTDANQTKNSDLILHHLLRFINQSVLFQHDGYFSYEYYCSNNDINYLKKFNKFLGLILKNQNLTENKKVSFNEFNNNKPIKETMNNENTDYMHNFNENSLLNYSLFNSEYNSKFNNNLSIKTVSITSLNPTLEDKILQIIVKLIKLFDYELQNLSENFNESSFRYLFSIIFHLQYTSRSVSFEKFLRILYNDTNSDVFKLAKNFFNDFILKWNNLIYNYCSRKFNSNNIDSNRSKLQLLILLCGKIYDLFMVLSSKIDTSSMLSILEDCYSNVKLFDFCIMFYHFNLLSKLPMSSNFSLVVSENNNIIKKLYFEENEMSMLNSQLKTLCFDSTDLDYDFYVKTILLMLKQNLSIKSKCSVSSVVLNHVYNNLQKLDSYQLNLISSSFIINSPLLCKEIFKSFLEQLEMTTFVKDFEVTLANYIILFFKYSLKFSSLITSDDFSNARKFIQNSVVFWSFTLKTLFQTFPKFEAQIKNLLKDIKEIIQDIIVDNVWNNFNYNLIILQLSKFLDILISGYSGILPHYNCEEVSQIKNKFHEVTSILLNKLCNNMSIFFKDNISSYLHEIESDEKINSLQQLFAVKDLFSSSNNINILESIEESPVFCSYLNEKLNIFEKTIYHNISLAVIIRNILENVYLNPEFKMHLITKCDSTLINDQTLSANNFDSSDIFKFIRLLLKNLYHCECFMKFYYTNNPNDKSFIEQKQKFNEILSHLKNEVDAIFNLLKSNRDQLLNNDLKEFFIYLITTSDKKDLDNYSFSSYCFENYFKDSFIWMDILNYIGFENQLDFNNYSSLSYLFILNSSNIGELVKILNNVLNFIKDNQEDINENQKSAIDWSSISSEKINNILFIINIALLKLSKCLEEEFKEEIYVDLKSILIDILNLFSFSKIDTLFDPNVPKLSSPEYVKFLTYTNFLIQSINSLKDDFQICHFIHLFSVLKLWIQTVYTSLPENLEKNNTCHVSLSILLLGSRVLNAFNSFNLFFKSTISCDESESKFEIKEMYRNFLAFDSFNMLLPLFIIVNDSSKSNIIERIYLNRLAEAINFIDNECLSDITSFEPNTFLLVQPYGETSDQNNVTYGMLNQFLKKINFEENSKNKLNCATKEQRKFIPLVSSNSYYNYLLKNGVPILLHKDLNRSLSSYNLLSTIIHSVNWENKIDKKEIINQENLPLGDASLNMEVLHVGPPKEFSDLLEKLDKVVTYILMDYRFEEIVFIECHTDVYNYTLAYLLSWLLYIHLIIKFPLKANDENEIRTDLISFLSERNLQNRLFDNLFHLMVNEEQNNDLDCNNESIHNLLEQFSVNNIVGQNIQNIFDQATSFSLAKLSLCVYYQFLRYLPNELRIWFNNLKHHERQIVEYFTTKHFSRFLIDTEMENFQTVDRDQFGNINIKTSKKTNEITAVYSLNEICFGIKFDFKPNYPLTAVAIECFNRSGVSEDRCRKWIQRLSIFFNKMNCSVLDGIVMLRPNMDKFFEDIEECIICLFVLYGGTSQLPRFRCPQCRKKFHWACIRKWFQTNHTSTCPQCKYEYQ